MTERKLVTIRNINELLPIEGADMIECAAVDGWNVVVKKGEFEEGDQCVFFEIDSWLPADDERFSFLRKTGVKKATDGKERIRLKTVKLRGQISQGLALPIELFSGDLSELDVIKYERPEPKQANAAGNFPDCIKKTDEERIQNVYGRLQEQHENTQFIPTLKLDGSSCTVAFLGKAYEDHWKNDDDMLSVKVGEEKIGEVAVCSRNLHLKFDMDSHFYKAASASNVIDAVKIMGRDGYNLAVQGEVMGPVIQGNKEKLSSFEMFVFSIFDIDKQEYISFSKVVEICNSIGMKHVPIVSIDDWYPLKHNVKEILAMSDGPSMNAKLREGIVWKSVDGSASFKAISNKWLLKVEE